VLLDKTMGKRSTGRPGYSHLVCYVKNPVIKREIIIAHGSDAACRDLISHRTSHFAVPDIFYRGEMLWPKAIGLDCCYVGMMFLKEIAKASIVFDPFCGQGTVLAMANALGMDSKGVEISAKRCRKAMRLKITDEHLDLVCSTLKSIKLEIVDERKQHYNQVVQQHKEDVDVKKIEKVSLEDDDDESVDGDGDDGEDK